MVKAEQQAKTEQALDYNFSAAAKRVVGNAADAVESLHGATHITPEFLLMGLIEDESVIGCMDSQGLQRVKVIESLENFMKPMTRLRKSDLESEKADSKESGNKIETTNLITNPTRSILLFARDKAQAENRSAESLDIFDGVFNIEHNYAEGILTELGFEWNKYEPQQMQVDTSRSENTSDKGRRSAEMAVSKERTRFVNELSNRTGGPDLSIEDPNIRTSTKMTNFYLQLRLGGARQVEATVCIDPVQAESGNAYIYRIVYEGTTPNDGRTVRLVKELGEIEGPKMVGKEPWKKNPNISHTFSIAYNDIIGIKRGMNEGKDAISLKDIKAKMVSNNRQVWLTRSSLSKMIAYPDENV